MPYLTDEQRKEQYSDSQTHFHFESKTDLSDGVTVYQRYPINEKHFDNILAQETACFIVRWTISIREKLNGFSGMDCVNFNVERLKKQINVLIVGV